MDINIIKGCFSILEKLDIDNIIAIIAIFLSIFNFIYGFCRDRKTDKEQKKIKEENDKKYVQQETLVEERERLRNELYEEMTRAFHISTFLLRMKI